MIFKHQESMTALFTNIFLIPNPWDILSESNNKENIFH